MFRLADALHHSSTATDELFGGLQRHFDTSQILELCPASGRYHAISSVIDVARIPLEPWAARFADETTTG